MVGKLRSAFGVKSWRSQFGGFSSLNDGCQVGVSQLEGTEKVHHLTVVVVVA